MTQRLNAAMALASAVGLTAALQYVATLPVIAGTWMVTLLLAG